MTIDDVDTQPILPIAEKTVYVTDANLNRLMKWESIELPEVGHHIKVNQDEDPYKVVTILWNPLNQTPRWGEITTVFIVVDPPDSVLWAESNRKYSTPAKRRRFRLFA